jgi:hypothetical protein
MEAGGVRSLLHSCLSGEVLLGFVVPFYQPQQMLGLENYFTELNQHVFTFLHPISIWRAPVEFAPT